METPLFKLNKSQEENVMRKERWIEKAIIRVIPIYDQTCISSNVPVASQHIWQYDPYP